MDAACEALTDMPPRLDEELDAVTLHNQALMNMEDDPEGGFEKLQFLLQQNPCPPGAKGGKEVQWRRRKRRRTGRGGEAHRRGKIES